LYAFVPDVNGVPERYAFDGFSEEYGLWHDTFAQLSSVTFTSPGCAPADHVPYDDIADIVAFVLFVACEASPPYPDTWHFAQSFP
jgi:hypothetical protein